jgi:hypothetical protein
VVLLWSIPDLVLFWERSQNFVNLLLPVNHVPCQWQGERQFPEDETPWERSQDVSPNLTVYRAGNALFISSVNCAGKNAPDSGALGSAPDMWLLLRGLPV